MPDSDATKASWLAKLAHVFGLGNARAGNSASQDENAYNLIDYLPNRQESCIQGAIEAIETNHPLVRQTIARTTYHLDRWSALATRKVKEANLTPEHVLGALVRTPPHEPPETPWDFSFRAQVAAALVITRASERSRSDPLDLLSDIADGPLDWTTSAAIIALLDVARRQRWRRAEIFIRLMDVVKRPQSPIWFMNAGHIAAVACRQIPGLEKGVYATLDRIIDKLS